jgi:hypothetical protein
MSREMNMDLSPIIGRRRPVTFTSRRGLLAAATAGLLAARQLAIGGAEGEAKKKRSRKRKRKNNRKKNDRTTIQTDAICPVGAGVNGGLASTDGNNRFAQTFTALKSGELVRAELLIFQFSSEFGDFILQVGTVDAFGVPTNEVLASTSVAGAGVPSGESTIAFAFARPATVAAGEQYALILTRPGSNGLRWQGHFGDTCGGRAFVSNDQTAPFEPLDVDNDFIFTTFVRS